MKARCLLLPAVLWMVASTLHAAENKSPFTDDLDAARAKAKEAHKDVLVDFTGSDWCGWCITLDKEVFHTPDFKEEAEKTFELVQLDFPSDKSKQTPETVARNSKWKSELKSRSFPNVLLLDEKGTVFARTGYRAGGPKVYLAHLESLRQRRIQRDAALDKAAKATGVERARHLYDALAALRNDEVCLAYYKATIQEVIALDGKNEAGVQEKCKSMFRREQCEQEINSLCQEKDGAAVLSKLKEYAARTDIPVESRQYALYMAAAMACERLLHDYAQGLKLIDEAIAVAPDSPLVEERLNEAKVRMEKRR